MKKVYQNYHKHDCWSNIFTPDSTVQIEDYIHRALELGHNVISSVCHGWQGNYYKVYEAVNKANQSLQRRRDKGEEDVPQDLKFIFGTEAYWVKDRKTDDKLNEHIIILAKNEEGRREINDILSEASISGYYYKPRIDLELLLSLNPNNVMVTTACVRFWDYEDVEDIVVKLFNHFKNNFYLEVQYHNIDKQKKLNKKILEISKKYNIQMIMGCDSHYIYPSDSTERDNLLDAKDIHYPEEEGWYLDYPSYEEAYKRFKVQEILTDEEIEKAINNTNIILTFDDITFNKDIKLPTLYPNLTQEQKDKKLKDIINESWKRDYLPILNKQQKKIYLDGIRNEYDTITSTQMTDYFLLDYEIVKRGKERGGIISKTARGSGGSFFINTLLGFSNLNRFESPVKLYPERFMSKTRILKSKSLPDLDLNLGTVDIFAEVQEELLGKNHAYPMIAFGQLKTSSAFKMYCRSQGLDYQLANEISKQIKDYEKALKNADSEEEKELIDLYDYVDRQYEKYIEESKKYQGIIDSKSKAPCAYLLYSGDIRREIGLMKCKSESTKKEYITTVVDGYVAEEYKFVKNDLLKVDVANIVKNIYDSIGRPQDDIKELTRLTLNDEKTWDIYAKGYTLGVNQMESNFGVQCCKQYKPKDIGELTALVSALRPGFKSMLQTFLNRQEYSTGVKALDNLLTDSYRFIIYQENIMTYLGWLGIEQTETYEIIKKISKKKFTPEKLKELKQRLLIAWESNTGSTDGFEESFHVVEDFSKYAFNASHAYAYAYDSLYGAYLKANYPYHFYSVMLSTYTQKGKKDKVTAYKKEMLEAFEIKEGEYKFRKDNRNFSIDIDNSCINPCLSSIKDMGKNVAEDLYKLKDNKYNTFIDLLKDLKTTSVNSKMLTILIKMNYFSEFGNPNQLLKIVEIFNQWDGRATIKKEKLNELNITYEFMRRYGRETDKQFNNLDSNALINELVSNINIKTTIHERLKYQHETCGYCYTKYPKYKNIGLILDIDTKYSPVITVYRLDDGTEIKYKIYKKTYNKNLIQKYDLIQLGTIEQKQKTKKVGDDWINIEGYNYWLYGYKKIEKQTA